MEITMAQTFKNPVVQANAMIYGNNDINKAVTDRVMGLINKGSVIQPGNHSYSGINGMVEMTNPDKTRTRVTTENKSSYDWDNPDAVSVYNETYPEDNSSIGWNDWPGKGTKSDEQNFYQIDEGRAPRHTKKYTDNLDFAKMATQKNRERSLRKFREEQNDEQPIKPNPAFVDQVISEASKVRGLGGKAIKPDQIRITKNRHGYNVYVGDKFFKGITFGGKR